MKKTEFLAVPFAVTEPSFLRPYLYIRQHLGLLVARWHLYRSLNFAFPVSVPIHSLANLCPCKPSFKSDYANLRKGMQLRLYHPVPFRRLSAWGSTIAVAVNRTSCI